VRQRIRLPLLEVVLVVEPLIEQLPKVDFDLAPHAAINRLHLVGLVGRHLVVVDANRLHHRGVWVSVLRRLPACAPAALASRRACGAPWFLRFSRKSLGVVS